MVDRLTPQQEKALALALKDNVAEPLAQLTAQVRTYSAKLDKLLDEKCKHERELNRLRGVLVCNGFGSLAFPTVANSNTRESTRTARSVDLPTQRIRPDAFQKTPRDLHEPFLAFG
jgi:hypothetical protein